VAQIGRVPARVLRPVEDAEGVADADLLEGAVPPEGRVAQERPPLHRHAVVDIEGDRLDRRRHRLRRVGRADVPALGEMAERGVLAVDVRVVLVREVEGPDPLVAEARPITVVLRQAVDLVVDQDLQEAGIGEPPRARLAEAPLPLFAAALLPAEAVGDPRRDVRLKHLERDQGSVLRRRAESGFGRQEGRQVRPEEPLGIHHERSRPVGEREEIGEKHRRIRKGRLHRGAQEGARSGAEVEVLLGQDEAVARPLPGDERVVEHLAARQPVAGRLHQGDAQAEGSSDEVRRDLQQELAGGAVEGHEAGELLGPAHRLGKALAPLLRPEDRRSEEQQGGHGQQGGRNGSDGTDIWHEHVSSHRSVGELYPARLC
jgi:hypothetical protein